MIEWNERKIERSEDIHKCNSRWIRIKDWEVGVVVVVIEDWSSNLGDRGSEIRQRKYDIIYPKHPEQRLIYGYKIPQHKHAFKINGIWVDDGDSVVGNDGDVESKISLLSTPFSVPDNTAVIVSLLIWHFLPHSVLCPCSRKKRTVTCRMKA